MRSSALKPLSQFAEALPSYLVQNFRKVTDQVATDIIALTARVTTIETNATALTTRVTTLESKGFVSQNKWGPM